MQSFKVLSLIIYKDAINKFAIKNDKMKCIYTAILQNRVRKLTIFFFVFFFVVVVFQILGITNKIIALSYIEPS